MKGKKRNFFKIPIPIKQTFKHAICVVFLEFMIYGINLIKSN